MLRRALLVVALLFGATLVWTPLTAAAATSGAIGWVTSAQQDTFFHKLIVNGHAYLPDHPSASIDVRIYIDGQYSATVHADLASATFNASRGITGKHNFHYSRTWTPSAGTITVKAIRPDGSTVALRGLAVTHYWPSPGVRIITIAKRYVGYPYVEGGSTPSGFDCSGYTRYVYSQAHVASLPHNAEAQRRMTGMRLISRSSARPGDLVFYLSGGSAYHVAIYAGSGMQYAAATVRDGVRYQAVWSSAVQYGTDWH